MPPFLRELLFFCFPDAARKGRQNVVCILSDVGDEPIDLISLHHSIEQITMSFRHFSSYEQRTILIP